MSRAKAPLLIILAVIFVAGAAGASVIVWRHSKNHANDSAGSGSQTLAAATNEACSIFTLADARQLLDGNTTGGAMAVTGSSADAQVTGCSYKLGNSANTPPAPTNTASLIVHQPKTAQGTAGNQKIFDGQRPPEAQAVSGYGDKAFWDIQLGQLNILKHNVWYVLTYGSATPAGRSLEQTRQLAGVLISKL